MVTFLSHPISFGTAVGLGSTAIGTGIGIAWSKWAGRRQERKLQDIEEALSTRYIGAFPDYLSEVADLIGSARKSLEILCTYPQHGAFSAPREWRMLYAATMKAIVDETIDVHMIFSSSDERVLADTLQFKDAFEDSEGWLKRNRQKLDAYVASHLTAVRRNHRDGTGPAEDFKVDNAYEWLWFQDEAEKATVQSWTDQNPAVDIRETGHLMPLFVWLVDGRRKAIFVVMTYDSQSVGHAFWTRDRGLIDALKNLVERYRGDSRSFRKDAADFGDAARVVRAYREARTVTN